MDTILDYYDSLDTIVESIAISNKDCVSTIWSLVMVEIPTPASSNRFIEHAFYTEIESSRLDVD